MECKSRILVILAICLLMVWATAVQAAVIYVALDGDDSDGSTWAKAYNSVQDGINAASSEDEVWVKAGTYVENINFSGHSGISLYGGFDGTETERSERNWNTNVTTLNGNQTDSVIKAPYGVSSTLIDGFTITNGKGYLRFGNSYRGGGIYAYSSITIMHNIITGNVLGHVTNGCDYGAGIHIDGGNSTITDNQITNNDGVDYNATYGGGISLMCSNNVVERNYITGNNSCYGSGICSDGSNLVIQSNNIVDNTGTYGGGIRLTNAGGSVSNNSITRNTAPYGSGIYLTNVSGSIDIANNTIAYNTYISGTNHGALKLENASPTVANNIIVFNSGWELYVASGTPSLVNNCVYDTDANLYYNISAGSGDISSDPLFVDAINNDFHLASNSPCIDAGEDDEVGTGWVDLDDGDRQVDDPYVSSSDTVDMGAYEFAIIHVKTDGDDEDDGYSWSTAKATISAALGIASSGDEIWVADGTHSDSVYSITVPAGVKMLGGFDGTETSSANRDWATNTTSISYYDGIIIGSGATVDGFDISGGITCSGSSVFSHNILSYSGQYGILAALTCMDDDQVVNNLFHHNTYILCDGSAIFNNNTVTASDSESHSPAIICPDNSSPTIANNIIANNSYGGIQVGSNASVALSHNCVYPSSYSGITPTLDNINADPLFVGSGDYHLQANSPCVNAGDDGEIDATSGIVEFARSTDLGKETRICETHVDMGAYEVEYSAPSVPVVTDDGAYQISATTLHASWSSSDINYDVTEYQYAIGTSSSDPGSGYVVGWTTTTNTSVTRSDLTLTDGQTYYFYVKAKNEIDLWSRVGVSDGITVDSTPPSTPVVTTNTIYSSDITQLAASWASTDSGSGIASYQYAIGTSPSDPGAGYTVGWTSTGSTPSATLNNLTLINGCTYHFYVKAIDNMGNVSTSGISDGITINEVYAQTGKGMIDRDFLCGLGSFSQTADIAYQYWDGSNYINGNCDASDNIDTLGVGWVRYTSFTPSAGTNLVCDVSTPSGYTSDCQYLALKDVSSGVTAQFWNRCYIPLGTGSNDIHIGDTLHVEVGYCQKSPSNAPITARVGINGDWADLNLSGITTHDWVVASGTSSIRVAVAIQSTDTVSGEAGIYVDDIRLYAIRGGNRIQVLVPAPRNRNTQTMLVFFNPQTMDIYDIATKYDMVEPQCEYDYISSLQLRYFNPNVKLYLYESGGCVNDYSTNGVDAFYNSSPLGFCDVLNNHPTWLYWDGNNPIYNSSYPNAYYAQVSNTDYQQAWWYRTADKVDKYDFDGVFIDTLGCEDASTLNQTDDREPWEVQSFLHAVPTSFRQGNKKIMHNECTYNLRTGYDQSAYLLQNKYKEAGLIWNDPNWRPYDWSGVISGNLYMSTSSEYAETNGYLGENSAANNADNTADISYQEWAFFLIWVTDGVNQNHYEDCMYWQNCIEDMEKMLTWNYQGFDKQVVINVHGVDRLADPAEGINGWAHFGLCSYLLGINPYTIIEFNRIIDTTSGEIPMDYSPTVSLGAPDGGRHELAWLYNSAGSGTNRAMYLRHFSNGLVVVNASSATTLDFSLTSSNLDGHSGLYVEGSGTYYAQNSTYSMPPHSGRIFYYAP